MKHNHIRLISILGSFSIVGIIVVQIYWLQMFWTTTEHQFDKNIQDALKSVAENIITYNGHNLPNQNPVKKLSSDYYVVNTEDLIDAYILEYYLKNEFNQFNIYTDFEYAIYDCSNDKMIYGNYVSLSNHINNLENMKISEFPKYENFLYYFGIYFPTKETYLGDNMKIWSIFSFILLLAVVFFAYSIFIILQQKRLSELQKEFINNMTHEFKTPISTINISADVISDPKIIQNPERLLIYASIIKQENKRLNHQVEKVLQITKIEKGILELNKEYFNLNQVLEDVVIKRKSNCLHNNLNFKLDLSKTKEIFADKLHFTNIIFNLLDNSIKYNPHKKLLITIKTYQKKENITLSIKDDGIGISKNFQKKIFDKFFRIPTGNIHNIKGFGLGLYYVKTICDAHKWSIKLDNEIKKGCNFIFKI